MCLETGENEKCLVSSVQNDHLASQLQLKWVQMGKGQKRLETGENEKCLVSSVQNDHLDGSERIDVITSIVVFDL